MYETPSLIETALLNAAGHRIVSTRVQGSIVFFTLDCDTTQAACLLNSPQRQFVETFYHSVRRVRRSIDQALLQRAGL